MAVINLEAGMPTVETARIRMEAELRHSKAQKIQVVKLIHGYGSSGKGGAIKRDVAQFLAQRKREGGIREFVQGENFSPFDPRAREMLMKMPELAKDKDYSRGNAGVTIVLL